MERIFTHIKRVNLWQSTESVSGRGSELAGTEAIRTALPDLLQAFQIASILDAPCGDFNWMHHVPLSGIDYTGIDVVSEIIQHNQRQYGTESIRFQAADITKATLPQADLIICRDCWVHLSLANISGALKQFKRSGATYLLTTTYPATQANVDSPTGSWRSLNLLLPPFNFPAPLKLLTDPSDDTQAHPDKALGLWKLVDLPEFQMAPWYSFQVLLTSLIRHYVDPAWKL